MNQSIENIEPLADSVANAAARLGVSRSFLYLLIKGKELQAIKLRRRTLVTREEQSRFLRSLASEDR